MFFQKAILKTIAKFLVIELFTSVLFLRQQRY